MKRILTLAALIVASGLAARAQVYIVNDFIFQGRMSEIKTTVVDSLTLEPVGFASVYVIPSKDTTITNFTLTDAKGEAKLDEVPYGSYFFHVEMMGYKPFVRERFFREEKVDLGTVKLQQDELFLKAAMVTDVGNPIVIKQDTVEFNASSFRMGANAMLKDLLQRMPGMEITEDGKVKFNGEAIDKLTVGGRTFFFNDQSTALNNLPAAIVDKIRVIDRESEQTRASGIQDGSREKVLDVALKKEYEQGWFGNLGLKGGTTLGRKEGDDVLRDDRGLLYSGNALISAYSEKDQVTVIANGQNINESNVVVVVVDEDGQRTRTKPGLSTAAQLGVNANTSRIKDVETTVSANFKYTDTDSGTRADRTTFQDDGDLQSSTQDSGKSYADGLSANLEFKKESGKVWFHVRPSFRYDKTDTFNSGVSETYRAGSLVNSSDNTSHSLSLSKTAVFNSDITFRELGDKGGRTVWLGATVNYRVNSGESDESSVLTTGGGIDSRAMRYDSGGRLFDWSGSIGYTEPLGEKWTLSAAGDFSWSRRNSVRDAFDAAGRNDYYSSGNRTRYMAQKYSLSAQYKFGERSWFTVGGSLSGILNEVFSKSYGIEEFTGKDEWNWFVTPTLRFQHSTGNDRFNVSASGYTQRPAGSRMLPVLNITDPSRLTVGNVYLKPSSYSHASAFWTRNNREKFSTFMVYLYGQFQTKPVVSAIWYDPDGILYSVPVNAQKPSFSTSLMMDYTTPLDTKKLWSLTLEGSADYSFSTGYQARTALPGLDKDSFDYSAFMAGFWGNAGGDRFYGGLSGFGESRTNVISPSAECTVEYNQEHYSFSAGAGTQGNLVRYSLNPKANLNTLDSWLTARATYITRHEFELGTGLSYVFYKGYPAGYGQPEWKWNAEISKNIGAFNLSVTAYDILNQTRTLTHTITANYVEDSYRLVMGRYILFGVKWNFGKMNAVHSQRAQQAARNLVF